MVEAVAEVAVAAAGVSIKNHDRVGLGWRPQLASGILSNLERIDVIEVIAEDYSHGSARLRALQMLAKQVPVVIHGVSLGMASTAPVDRRRLEKMARLVDKVQSESWSEHLAFVRAGSTEIGHLAAPPRTRDTIEATAANLAAAQAMVGVMPHMENIATLIDPPASDLDEPAWLSETLACSGARLLLDLQNLYTNSINFGLDSGDFLTRIPLERVHTVHISGGKWIGNGDSAEKRFLDDHLHDPPLPVYDLLTELAARCPNPLTVVLERDGKYPPIEHLLAQLDLARCAMARGRARFLPQTIQRSGTQDRKVVSSIKRSALEPFLAKIYVDPASRANFLAAPGAWAAHAGLTDQQCSALDQIDRVGLQMAAQSFARKRALKVFTPDSARSRWQRVAKSVRRLFHE